MNKLFYDHLIKIEEIQIVLEKTSLAKKEKKKILKLVDETIHYKVLETILDSLDKKLHKEFLTLFYEKPFDEKLMDFLRQQVEDIEEKILQTFEEIKEELLGDLS